MNRAVFLDRDGTINEDTHYLSDPRHLKILPHVINGLKELQKAGFLLVIVTNQSGIGRGYFKEAQLHRIHAELLQIFKKNHLKITKIYYSPHFNKSKITKYKQGAFQRKPMPGMILQAAKELDIALPASYMIGDNESDIGAGFNAGLKTNILITNQKKNLFSFYQPDIRVRDFGQAVDYIIKTELAARVITQEKELSRIIKELRKKKKIIVTTNGVFDILHTGHVRYLNRCKKSGNILIVGINSDSSVKKNKGKNRPINDQFTRAEIVASLKSVDYTYIFNDKDPRSFLKIIKPHIHIKGGDYALNQIIERKVVEFGGGKIKLVQFTKGFSTTELIKKCKKL